MDALPDIVWSFLILLAVFLPLELLFPANGRRVLHKESFTDLLEYWEADPRTKVILVYAESFAEPR